jgi:hypothetical protein
MKAYALVLLLSTVLFAGCSTLKVVPRQVPQGVVNLSDNSQTITRDGVSIKAANSTTEMVSYNLDGTVTAFVVTIDNQSPREIGFDAGSFVLLDDQNRQYLPLTPEKVKDLMTRDSYYLIPYPYVGFYYLEDYEKISFYNSTESQLPYYYEVYPQDIQTRALEANSVIPGAKVTGLVYFLIDLGVVKEVKLHIYRSGSSKSTAPDFIFPFVVGK